MYSGGGDSPFLYPGPRLTNIMDALIKSILSFSAASAICRLLKIIWNTDEENHKEFVTSTRNKKSAWLLCTGYGSKYLAVDEVVILNGHRYAAVVMDIETGEVLWVGRYVMDDV